MDNLFKNNQTNIIWILCVMELTFSSACG